MLRLANHAIYATCLAAVLLADAVPVHSVMLMIACLIVDWAVTVYALDRTRDPDRSDLAVMTTGVAVFFWIAYVSKLAGILYFPEAFWVVPKVITAPDLVANVGHGFALASIGYTVLIASCLTATGGAKMRWRVMPFRPHLGAFTVVALLLLPLKYELKARFNLAVPGLDPEYLGVPLLAGGLALLISIGALVFVNLYLFCALYTARGSLVMLALLAIGANAGIDLAFGSKFTVMYQLVILAAYVLVLKKNGPPERLREIRSAANMALVFAVVGGIFVIATYKYMNFYRFALLFDTSNIWKAIDLAMNHRIAAERSSLMEIYSRLTGLEHLTAAVRFAEGRRMELGPLDMVSGQVTREFTNFIIGNPAAKALFGVTQFAYFFIAGGYFGLIAGVFLLGRLFVWLQTALISLPIAHSLKIAALPVLWLQFVKVLLGSGDLLVWSKEMFIFMLVVVLVPRFLVAGGAAPPRRAAALQRG